MGLRVRIFTCICTRVQKYTSAEVKVKSETDDAESIMKLSTYVYVSIAFMGVNLLYSDTRMMDAHFI